MTIPNATKSDIGRIKKLYQIARSLRQKESFNITRLTSIKSLCKDPDIAALFSLHLATLTYNKLMKRRRSSSGQSKNGKGHYQLMEKALAGMENYRKRKTSRKEEILWDLFQELKEVNNEYRDTQWGLIRTIKNSDVLLIEYAMKTMLYPLEADTWAYQTARHYAERYDSIYGTGLIPSSAPLVKDIVDFWCNLYSISFE